MTGATPVLRQEKVEFIYCLNLAISRRSWRVRQRNLQTNTSYMCRVVVLLKPYFFDVRYQLHCSLLRSLIRVSSQLAFCI